MGDVHEEIVRMLGVRNEHDFPSPYTCHIYIPSLYFDINDIKSLFNRGVGLNTSDLLHVAAEKGDHEAAELFLNNGADVDALTVDGLTPLYLAAKNGRDKVVKLLLQHGPDINSQCNKKALYAAVQRYGKGHHVVVKDLLEYGFKFDPEQANNLDFLYRAVQGGFIDFIQALLDFGADVKNMVCSFSETLLHVAVNMRQVEVARMLINHNVDVNVRNCYGQTALYLAAFHFSEYAARMIKSNANAENLTQQCLEIATILLDHGAVIDLPDLHGVTILHTFARYGHEEICNLLLSRGANVHATTWDGYTPLHSSLEGGHAGTVKLLLENGAKVCSRTASKGWTPLHIAAQFSGPELVKMIIEAGADVDCKDKMNRTALDLAVEKNREEVVATILKITGRV